MPSEGTRIANVWRPLALAAVLSIVIPAMAAAQIVIVREAPGGSNVEVVVNSKTAGTGTVNVNGDVVISSDLQAHTGKGEIEAYLHVDTCPDIRRVVIVERGVLPPAWGENCDRREIPGLFVVRRTSTLVFNVGATNPTVLLRQGSFSLDPPRVWAPAPKGVALFGGGGFAMFRDAVAVACGDVTDCSGEDFRGALTAGAIYWFARAAGVEASYVKPGQVTAQGAGEGFRFNSTLDPELIVISGKVGFPKGPVRIYGHIGTNYHRATVSNTQTNEERKVTIDGVEQTIPGGTQTFDQRTAGWGWQFGGGIEIWFTRSFAFYSEFSRATIKGDAIEGAEGFIDERLTSVMFGARVRLGR